MLSQIYIAVYYNVYHSKSLNIKGSFSLAKTVPAQWGFDGVTYSDGLSLSGVPSLLSIADLNDQVPYPPEFAAYVLDPTRGNSTADMLYDSSDSGSLFVKDVDE